MPPYCKPSGINRSIVSSIHRQELKLERMAWSLIDCCYVRHSATLDIVRYSYIFDDTKSFDLHETYTRAKSEPGSRAGGDHVYTQCEVASTRGEQSAKPGCRSTGLH
jgi:hypothetical protein